MAMRMAGGAAVMGWWGVGALCWREGGGEGVGIVEVEVEDGVVGG